MIRWILKLIKKYKAKLTLQHQLLAFSLLLLILTCLLIYVAITIITNIIGDILINSSTIVYEKQTQKMISNYDNLQSHLFQTYLSINNNHLIGIQELFLQKEHLEIDLQLPQISQNEEYSQQLCYTNLSFYNESDQGQQNDTIFFEFLSTIGNFMDFTNKTTYFGYELNLPNIYFTYPCKSQAEIKTVQQQNISEIDLTSYSQYQSILQEPQKIMEDSILQFTQLLPLIDNQKQIQGILGANTLYNFGNLNSNLNNIEYNGQILFQDIVKSPLEYIFDYEISGFSYDDWLYMINHDDHYRKNKCFSTIPDKELCLKNIILQKEYLIYPQNHSGQKFYSFILVTNNAVSEYQRVEDIIQKDIIDQIFRDMLYIIITVVIISLILLQVLNKKIFKPLYRMGRIRLDQNVSHFQEILELQSFKNNIYILKNPLIDQQLINICSLQREFKIKYQRRLGFVNQQKILNFPQREPQIKQNKGINDNVLKEYKEQNKRKFIQNIAL